MWRGGGCRRLGWRLNFDHLCAQGDTAKQINQQLVLVLVCTSSLLVLVYEYEIPSVEQVFSHELINS